MYLVNKEYFFIISIYYVVCNNQNSHERATIELKKVNIYNQIPTFFSFFENTVGQNKSHQFILFCVIFSFPVKRSLFCINGFYLSDTVQKQPINFFYLPVIASILADWEMAPLYQSTLN